MGRKQLITTAVILALVFLFGAIGWWTVQQGLAPLLGIAVTGKTYTPPDPPAPKNWKEANQQRVAQAAQMGMINTSDAGKFYLIEHAGNVQGHISDSDLAWTLKLMQKPSPTTSATALKQEEMLAELNAGVKDFSPRQRDLYVPALIGYTKSPNMYVHQAALYQLWSLKDMRAAPAMTALVASPNSGLSPRQVAKFSKFAQHCRN